MPDGTIQSDLGGANHGGNLLKTLVTSNLNVKVENFEDEVEKWAQFFFVVSLKVSHSPNQERYRAKKDYFKRFWRS